MVALINTEEFSALEHMEIGAAYLRNGNCVGMMF